MKHVSFETHGTCSKQIDFDIDEEGRVQNVQFLGGCHGNLQGISRLIEGMKADDVRRKLEGIRCGYKNTSCPDQLAHAIASATE